MWCLTSLENGKQVVKKTGVVGHKSLSTTRLVVDSLSDIETSIFKALLTYHFLIMHKCMLYAVLLAATIKQW